MKRLFPIASSGRRGSARRAAAFTLPELVISLAVFLLLSGGLVGSNLFGLRMYQMNSNKLKSTDSARKAVGKMADEIRASKSILLGNVTNGVFAAKLDGEVQSGSGILIYPTTNASSFVIYFVNPSDQSFRRTTSAPAVTTILAGYVTNSVIFAAQDYSGNVLTNTQNNRVIHLALEFFQKARYGVAADYYKLETSVARRGL